MKVFGRHEANVLQQLQNCMDVEEGSLGVPCADGHLGYSQPIGGAVAYREHISPSGVGYDIGCGNKAVMTNLHIWDVSDGHNYVPDIMDEIVSKISFGMGRNNQEKIDHPVIDKIRDANFTPQRGLLELARKQLGTVGAGNHYVDLFVDEEDRIWIGVHFGSRGFGHKTASGFLAMAQGKDFGGHANEGEMMSPPVVFPVDSNLGESYIEAMTLAGEYAYAGRDVVCEKVLEILGAESVEEVHNHHNYAWLERHEGEQLWVVRKGCTPAFPGQRGFVGATMGEDAVILEGTGVASAEDALFSTVHGAGRAMSRTKAAGKVKRRKVWQCADRNCERTFKIDGVSSHNAAPKSGICPDHPNARLRKTWVTETKSKGLIDYDEVRASMAERGIALRGGAADEAPGAYKRLDEVLAAHGDTVKVLHRLRPIGVAMAGPNVRDDYKD